MASDDQRSERPPSFSQRVTNLCRQLLTNNDPPQRRIVLVVTIILVLGIGVVDFLLGFEISLLVFYCLPVLLATTLGWRFGAAVSFACVASWIVSDVAAGANYAAGLVPWWNAVTALGTYLVIVWLFHVFRTLYQQVEARVRERTAALSAEMRERARLEREILDITERERRLIGHDLHDGLGQHLTGTAFAGQVLAEKLQTRRLPEEEGDAWKIVRLVEDGIEKTRRLAKGLLLAEIQQDGLITALDELAQTTTGEYRVRCELRTEGDCGVRGSGVATHLLRIAQEAVRNAVRHGSTRQISIFLRGHARWLELEVRDSGKGLPAAGMRGDGLGLRIMAHRAQIIGGQFTIAAAPEGGTVVTCRVPR
ncbi:MAG TPA: ATP-binding protein [Opitutaceae bacterium]|nr:ATP-binding protein [Opitutaceae bacterium]